MKLAPHQLQFYRELLAPFPQSALSFTKRGGKDLTYIDKRSLSNRLDSVCGPHGWYCGYTETKDGLICHLSILCPIDDKGTWQFVTKSDGAGPEEMGSKNRDTGEFEITADDNAKSAFTNAFRRACQDAWGVARYLYGKGIPDFLDPNATAIPNASPPPPQQSQAQAPPAHAPAPQAASQGQRQYDNFKIPKPGKSVFAWAKEMEKVFESPLTDGMAGDADSYGYGRTFADWNQDQVNRICDGAISFIKTLPTYKGQFEHVATPTFDANAKAAAPATQPGNQKTPEMVQLITDLRRDLATKLTALLTKQLGRKPENRELLQTFQGIGAECSNGYGHRGEVPSSLANMTDTMWMGNMISFTEHQIQLTSAPAAAIEADPTIPF